MKKLSPEAISILSSGIAITGSELRITAGQLDRKLYVEVNKALEAIGGAWKRGLGAHVFEGTPEDALDQILADGGFRDTKQELNRFFTPSTLAREVVKRADVRGKTVLEPSAGAGALAIECLDQGAKAIFCIEKDMAYSVNLKATLSKFGDKATVMTDDFLAGDLALKSLDRVVMNPPFARQQDIAHVTKAFSLLRDGGLLVAIMSAGVKFREDKKTKAFRALVYSIGGNRGTLEDLPAESFKASGTNVNTILVTMRKS